jgi:hypothetical protein
MERDNAAERKLRQELHFPCRLVWLPRQRRGNHRGWRSLGGLRLDRKQGDSGASRGREREARWAWLRDTATGSNGQLCARSNKSKFEVCHGGISLRTVNVHCHLQVDAALTIV